MAEKYLTDERIIMAAVGIGAAILALGIERALVRLRDRWFWFVP